MGTDFPRRTHVPLCSHSEFWILNPEFFHNMSKNNPERFRGR
jgi:hypothetical protein